MRSIAWPALLAGILVPTLPAAETGMLRQAGLWTVSVGPSIAAEAWRFPVPDDRSWRPLSRPRIGYFPVSNLEWSGEFSLVWDWRTPIRDQFLGKGIGRGSALASDLRWFPLATRLSPSFSLGADLDAGSLGTDAGIRRGSTLTLFRLGPQVSARTGMGMEWLGRQGLLLSAGAVYMFPLHARTVTRINDGPDLPPPPRPAYRIELRVGKAFQ
jgi:hypothetical protein